MTLKELGKTCEKLQNRVDVLEVERKHAFEMLEEYDKRFDMLAEAVSQHKYAIEHLVATYSEEKKEQMKRNYAATEMIIKEARV